MILLAEQIDPHIKLAEKDPEIIERIRVNEPFRMRR